MSRPRARTDLRSAETVADDRVARVAMPLRTAGAEATAEAKAKAAGGGKRGGAYMCARALTLSPFDDTASFERIESETEVAETADSADSAEAADAGARTSAFDVDWPRLSLLPTAAVLWRSGAEEAVCNVCKGMACNDMDRECADRADSGARKTGCVRGGPNWY